jgi:uncharacterized protein (TIGR02001 family)
MKHLNVIKYLNIVIAVVLFLGLVVGARAQVSGDVTLVSTYSWRGVKQNNGPALQSTAAYSAGPVEVGMWFSTVDFGGPEELESDFFVSAGFEVGAVEIAAGATVYSYDMFQSFNADADLEYEVFLSASTAGFSLAGYFVPEQASTESNRNKSDYWVEAGYGLEAAGARFGVLYGYGTYSSKWLVDADGVQLKDPVALVDISVARDLGNGLAIGYNYSLGLDDAMENIMYFSLGYSF